MLPVPMVPSMKIQENVWMLALMAGSLSCKNKPPHKETLFPTMPAKSALVPAAHALTSELTAPVALMTTITILK